MIDLLTFFAMKQANQSLLVIVAKPDVNRAATKYLLL